VHTIEFDGSDVLGNSRFGANIGSGIAQTQSHVMIDEVVATDSILDLWGEISLGLGELYDDSTAYLGRRFD
jgi:hypothetical protein